MEWLQFHTYHLDTLHPPIARLAVALPLYFSGLRFQEGRSSSLPDFWDAGNSILYQGKYLRNLARARFGILPFLVILVIVTFSWTRLQFGSFGALAAVVLVCTLPVVLSFASLAYTDFPAACMQVCCILAFAAWVERPGLRLSAVLGALFGLAVLTKFTSLLYVPVAAASIVLCRFVLVKRSGGKAVPPPRFLMKNLALIALITTVVVWGGYRFSVGGIDQALGITKQAMPSFQHLPGPVRGLAREMIASDWKIPAPEFFAGLANAWVMNKTSPNAYLFGRFKAGGWWYFFMVEALFKTPLPFLLLVLVGIRPLYRSFLEGNWKSLVPATAAVSIALLTTTVGINFGLRHVLVIFLFLAIVAGYGAHELWHTPRGARVGKALLIGLIGWQCFSVLRPSTDWIAYFNELAGRDPSKILVTGCDLDCGQDVLNLSDELRRRNVSHVGLALWTTADLQNMGLPHFDVLEPFQPRTGWVAISARAMREGSVQHNGYPPDAFAWLNQYKPITHVGSTIWLYWIPSPDQPTARGAVASTRG